MCYIFITLLISSLRADYLESTGQTLGSWTWANCPTTGTTLLGCQANSSIGEKNDKSLIIARSQTFHCKIKVSCFGSADPTKCKPDPVNLKPRLKHTGVILNGNPSANGNTLSYPFKLADKPQKGEVEIKFKRQCSFEPTKTIDDATVVIKVADVATEDSMLKCGGRLNMLKPGETHVCEIECKGRKYDYSSKDKIARNSVIDTLSPDIKCNEAQFKISIVNTKANDDLARGNVKIGRIAAIGRVDRNKLKFNVEGGTEVDAEYTVHVRLNGLGEDTTAKSLILGCGESNVLFRNVPTSSQESTPFANVIIFLVIAVPVLLLVFYCMAK